MEWDEWTPVAVIESAGRLRSLRSTHDGRQFHVLSPPNAGPDDFYLADNVIAGVADQHVTFLWREATTEGTERPI